MTTFVDATTWLSWILGGLISTAFLYSPPVRESLSKFSRSTDRPWPLVAAVWIAMSVLISRAFNMLVRLPFSVSLVTRSQGFGLPDTMMLVSIAFFVLVPVVIGLVIFIGVDWERVGSVVGRPIPWTIKAFASLGLGSAALWPFTLTPLVPRMIVAVREQGLDLPQASPWSILLVLLFSSNGYAMSWIALRGTRPLSAESIAQGRMSRVALAMGSIGLIGRGLGDIVVGTFSTISVAGPTAGPLTLYLPLAMAIAFGLWAAGSVSIERVRRALGANGSVLLGVLIVSAFGALLLDLISMATYVGGESAFLQQTVPFWWLLSAFAIIFALYAWIDTKNSRA